MRRIKFATAVFIFIYFSFIFSAMAEEACVSCHDIASDEIKAAHFGANIADAKCIMCHYSHDVQGSNGHLKLKEVIHAPIEIGRCGYCHKLTDSGKIEIKPKMKEICLGCHANIVSQDNKVVHSWFEISECTDCHNPHTSSNEKLLNKKQSELCFGCHDKSVAEKHPYDVESPKGSVTCTSCHNPHGAKIAFLLKEPLGHPGLCDNCHKKQ